MQFDPIRTPTHGGDGGSGFADIDLDKVAIVVGLTVWHSTYVEGIQFHWVQKDGSIRHGNVYGRQNTDHQTNITLERGEWINKIEGRNGCVVDFLAFTTNKGRRFECGGSGGSAFEPIYGPGLLGCYGGCGELIDRIGFIYSKEGRWLHYKDLTISFTSRFNLRWNDRSSGGCHDGAYWHPVTAGQPGLEGFFPVGDLGWSNYDDVNGIAAIAVCRDDATAGNPALAAPLGFDNVWNDRGSGASMDGTMWRPVPPPGYVALGLVCTAGHDVAPVAAEYRCVRQDLAVAGAPGAFIWDDSETGANRDFGSWAIEVPTSPSGMVYFSAGTYIGVSSHTKPVADNCAYGLKILAPETLDTPVPLPRPVMRSIDQPSPYENQTVHCTVTMPWFTVNDPQLTRMQQLAQCPVYTLERTDRYKQLSYGYNDTPTQQTQSHSVSTGTNGSSKNTFSETTSIKWSHSAMVGSDLLGKITTTWELSQSFTYAHEDASGWSDTKTTTVNVAVPTNTAVTCYAIESAYQLRRPDGSAVAPVDVPYVVASSVYWTSFPRAHVVVAGDRVTVTALN